MSLQVNANQDTTVNQEQLLLLRLLKILIKTMAHVLKDTSVLRALVILSPVLLVPSRILIWQRMNFTAILAQQACSALHQV